MITKNPRISTRDIACQMGATWADVWYVLSEEELHPFHLLKVQHLLPQDYDWREVFCIWIVHNQRLNRFILYTDEAQFTRHGFSNIHNNHFWDYENPHTVVARSFQEKLKVNVWCDVIENQQIVPHFFDFTVNSETYLHFFREQLPLLLEDVPLEIWQNMYYMHDGALAHRDTVITQYLRQWFPNCWISYNSPLVPWPAPSTDLTPLDFSI